MTPKQRIFRNASFLYGAEIVSRVMTIFLTLLVARRLGSSEFGKFAYVTATMALLQTLADFGLSTLIIKEVAADKTKGSKLAQAALVAKLGMSGVALVGVLVFILISHPSSELLALFILNAITLPIIAYSSTISSILRGHELMQYDAYSRAAAAALTTFIGIILVLSGYGIVALSSLGLALVFLNALYLGVICARRKLFKIKWRINLAVLGQLLKQALPFASVALLVTISFRIDTTMLGLMKPAAVVGQYSAAYRLLDSLLIIPGLFAGVLLPAMSERFRVSRESLQKLTLFSIKYFVYIGFGIAIGCTLLATQIISFLYGSGFGDSVLALQILSFALIPTFISAITSTVIAVSARPQINTYIALAMALFNIGANLLLIPHYSLYGASVNTLLTESLGLTIGTIVIFRQIMTLPYYRYFFKTLIAGAVMAGAIHIYPHLVLVPVYAALYGLTLVALKGIDRSDLSTLKQALPNRFSGLESS